MGASLRLSDQVRLRALACRELQGVLDACLYEPGGWRPPPAAGAPAHEALFPTETDATVPARDMAALTGTPCGLLFNEVGVHCSMYGGGGTSQSQPARP